MRKTARTLLRLHRETVTILNAPDLVKLAGATTSCISACASLCDCTQERTVCTSF